MFAFGNGNFSQSASEILMHLGVSLCQPMRMLAEQPFCRSEWW